MIPLSIKKIPFNQPVSTDAKYHDINDFNKTIINSSFETIAVEE